MGTVTTHARFAASTKALWIGIGFSLGFTGLIWATGNFWLERPPLTGPHSHGMWYRWQLVEPDLRTRASAWLGYAGHQLALWALIWRAQRERPAYTGGLHRFNLLALGANALFISLHYAQTFFWYDGLAQDVPEWTAQWSVIMLLVVVLMIENQRRGLLFGHEFASVTDAAQVVRRYHGYYFSWATIYTFWYHPMENTSGHLLGFAYMFLLLLQGSLFFTRAHINPYWTIVQELLVTAHGAMVAIMAGNGWPMFVSGFLGVFVITQMHGLGFSRRTRTGIGLLYLAGVAVIYRSMPLRVFEVISIPFTEFAAVALLSGLILLAGRWWRQRPGFMPAATTGPGTK